MSFVQLEFPLFFAAVFAAYWALRDRARQNVLLVVASAVFYGWVHPWFVVLLLGSASVDYLVGREIARRPTHREKLLAFSIVANLGLLFWFKYRDFFVVSVAAALARIGLDPHPRVLGLLLPLGISFYTFQTLSYTIDIYRGVLKPRESYLDYLAFVSLFPQLVAGPIERASRLLPQLEQPRVLRWDRVASGLGLALFGAFEKIVVADTLAPLVDSAYGLEDPAGAVIWAASAAFGVQVYADLAGYTDIARGTARMLGFELTKNFDAPFLATSTPDFWRRWHTSLSTWFRDYLLVPLLGDAARIGRLRLGVAVVASFLLIGLWHGASWGYVAFGLWHAAWVLFYLGIQPLAPGFTANPAGRAFAIVFHSAFVAIPSAFLFRAPTLERAVDLMRRAPWDGAPDDLVVARALLVLVLTLEIPLLLYWAGARWLAPGLARHRAPRIVATAGLWMLLLEAIAIFHRDTARDFVYFQF